MQGHNQNVQFCSKLKFFCPLSLGLLWAQSLQGDIEGGLGALAFSGLPPPSAGEQGPTKALPGSSGTLPHCSPQTEVAAVVASADTHLCLPRGPHDTLALRPTHPSGCPAAHADFMPSLLQALWPLRIFLPGWQLGEGLVAPGPLPRCPLGGPAPVPHIFGGGLDLWAG